jgi:hypothetical protein
MALNAKGFVCPLNLEYIKILNINLEHFLIQ